MNAKTEPASQTKPGSNVDVFSRVILGTLTLLLAFGQYQLATIQQSISKTQVTLQQQQVRLTQQNMDTQAVSLLRDYFGVLDKSDMEGRHARDVLSSTASHLTLNYGQTFFAQLVLRLLPPEVTEPPSTPPAIEAAPQEPAVIQISEATQPAPDAGDWFAVLTSYYESQEPYARKDVENFLKKLEFESDKPEGIEAIGLYTTKINMNFAITLGGRLTKQQAVIAATWARRKGWSKTAFAQVNREWKQLERKKPN